MEKLAPEMFPSRYIEKVSLLTGEVLEDEIEPRQLLVGSHRDYHIVDVQARRFMSRLVASTGDEEKARQRMKEVRRLGHRASRMIARALGQKDPTRVSRALFGLKDREYYFRYKRHPLPGDEIERRVEALQEAGGHRLEGCSEDGRPRFRVLLTGGTGFVGQEILAQAAGDPSIAELFVLIRPKEVRDRKTGEVVRVESPQERGEALLDRLWLTDPAVRAKFKFLAGDVEKPELGVAAEEIAGLEDRLTHVIHCAASVSFDDPYERSFRANVTGTVNALRFSRRLQDAEDSCFIAHLGIETSYIHGRQVRKVAREDEIVFPKSFYNNYYELTKAMASIETERFMLQEGLRVVQLNPAIVIGQFRTGNNRGDTKVVNAPVNLFGRAQEALAERKGDLFERSRVALLARMATIFPGDPSAELNLIPVDWVASGILRALGRPDAIGRRIHLATDNRVTSEEMQKIITEELEVKVTLAEPTLHRNLTLPLLGRVLRGFKQERLAKGLEKLGTIFAGYSEWGQPVHEVGNDVELLGMPESRPNTRQAFRMLCRHNRYVQGFGRVKDGDEIARRERIWARLLEELAEETGEPAGALAAPLFREWIEDRLDLDSFELKE